MNVVTSLQGRQSRNVRNPDDGGKIVMQKAWLQTLGKMVYGIYVLTTFHEEKVNGMIASWVSQVSYDPPMVMAAIHPNRYSHHLIMQSGFFALHILARNQADLLQRFKGSDPVAKFASISWVRGRNGCPILKESLAYMECEVKTSCAPGNHTLFVAEIKDAGIISDNEPLSTLEYGGIYLGRE
jgi:flavin reductase (DIM6/NTAB) family NADH-FMN oxidoreductase RutF